MGTPDIYWTFGDGNVGTGLTTSHAYTSTGTFSVALTVADGNYETTLKKNITVIESTAKKANCPDIWR